MATTAARALAGSDRAYIQVNGVVAGESKDPEAKQAAYQRADQVRKALIQWVGPDKFDEKRYEVGFSTGTEADPEVRVTLGYKPSVLSNPLGAQPGSPVPGGESQRMLAIEHKGMIVFEKPLPPEVKLSTPELAGKRRIVLKLSGEIDIAELMKDPEPPKKNPDGTHAPESGPPVTFGFEFTMNASDNVGIVAEAKLDAASRKISAEGAVVLKSKSGGEFKVPKSAIKEINDLVKTLGAGNQSAFAPQSSGESGPGSGPAVAQAAKIAAAVDALYQKLKEMKQASGSVVSVGAGVTVPYGEQKPEDPRGPTFTLGVTFFLD
jgi:hypothetical protein